MAIINDSKRQKISEDTDRISQLPDNILLEILSILPTKTAVATSVLATRWRYLWKSLHNLYFFDGWSWSNPSHFIEFSNFVNKVMHQHDISSILQFCLTCKELDSNNFDSWMSILVSRNIQDIIIYIQNPQRLLFPPCFFSCQSLKTLSIDVGVTIDIPTTISMPLLQELRLQLVGFSVKQAASEVSLTFPKLEKFVLHKCVWVDVKIVHVYAPILNMLEISDCEGIGILDCELKFYAENIRGFKLESYFPYRYSIPRKSLFAAFIDITSTHVTFPRVSSLFEEISDVRGMEITAFTVETMSYQEVSPHIVALSNLIYLSVIPGLAYAQIDERQMICVLSNMPKLVSISFPNGLCDFTVRGRRRRQRRTPESFLSNLRLVDIWDFSGNNDELWFIKFLLKKAQELLQISVKFGGSQWQNFSEKEKEKIIKRLQKLGRGSDCRIEIT